MKKGKEVSCWKCKLPFLRLLVLIFCLCYMFLMLTPIMRQSNAILQTVEHPTEPSTLAEPILHTVTDVHLNKSHFLYQLPGWNLPLRGIFFIAHACTHSAYDFWPKQAACLQCIGLSEEVAVTNRALNAGYLVVAVSSYDRSSGCWGGQHDIEQVLAILDYIQVKNPQVGTLPIVAYGCSSGGAFVWKLSQNSRISAVIIQVMSVNIKQNKRAKNSPFPVVFNSMQRDQRTSEAMEKNGDDLKALYTTKLKNNSRISEYVAVNHCSPLAVTADYLSDRLYYLNISHDEYQIIISILKKHGFLDNTSNMLLKDPTQKKNDWRAILIQDPASGPILNTHSIVLTRGKSPLAKALHRCWAFHEYCSDFLESDLNRFNNFS